MQRTFQIEFNELCPRLIDEFIEEGHLPNFRRLRDASEVFITDASDEISLEPWVQWPTLHTGIPDRDHGIQQLGEGGLVAGRGVARELAAAGFKVGVFGSMNLDYGPLDAFVVPDPWNPSSNPHPAELGAFTEFVVSAVQENSAGRLDKRAALPFVAYLTNHGLTPTSAFSVVRQLIRERRDSGLNWRRSLVLDQVSYDVFRNLVRRHDVAYATFFSNSTAHFQHYFWRNFRPDIFTAPSPREDHPSLTGALLQGYRNHDGLIGRFMSDFPDARIIFATALSQEPWDTTKCTYRPRNFEHLLELVGIERELTAVEPVMAEEFMLTFRDKATADIAITSLHECHISGAPLFRMKQTEDRRVKVGCAVNEWRSDQRVAVFPGGKTVPFDKIFYRIHSIRSGRHHPDGCFWVQSAAPRRVTEKVPLTAVAPTILRLFGTNAPGYMKEPQIDLRCYPG